MKLLSENLFEFKKGLDPVDSLGLGRRKLIVDWIEKIVIYNKTPFEYKINDDYTIDCVGDVHLSSLDLVEIPEYIQFNNVDGYFSCSKNNLTSLKGCPIHITGGFYAYENNLSSLKYGPTYVGKNYSCHTNNISTLEGFPIYIGGNLRLGYNKNISEQQIRKICNVKGDIFINL